MDHLVKELNPPQREAVETTKGPVMIIAGAGSGKTRVITYRIAYIIHKEKCPAKNILALTFTNRAANEMRERVDKLLGPGSTKGLWIGTFHSNFARLLRQHAEAIGFTKDFTIYDAEDSKKVIEEIMKEIGITKDMLSPNVIQSRISMAKNRFILPNQYSQSAMDYVEEKVAEVYRRYAERLRKNNALDFDDLLIKPIELFIQNPALLEMYQQRFEYLMIDEYQDTNRAQYMVAKMLAAKHRNICVVGDDAQSIYSWRGADISNILGFQNDYPEAVTCRLEENYRCTKNILRVANAVIEKNKVRLEKTLYTSNEEGDPVTLMVTMDERKEAEKVAMAIRELKLSRGCTNKDFAVFYRTNAQSRVLEDAMRFHGIPYQVFGSVSFYKRKEVKDVVAYLRFLLNERDEEALLRIINYPARGIGDTSIAKLRELAKEEELSLYDVICKAVQYDLQSRLISALVDFRMLIEGLRDLAERNTIYEVVAELYRKTRMLEILKNENTAEANTRYENLQEFLSYARDFSDRSPEDSSLAAFLQNFSLATDQDNQEDTENKVTLMTVHSAKGLEFPVVFVTGLEERLFPLNPDEPKELEEERRLFYVALTRAQKKLFVSYAKSRYRFGESKPGLKSRFIDELDASVVEMEGGKRLDDVRMNERERSRYQRDEYSQDHEEYNENWRKPQQPKPSQKFTAPAPTTPASGIVVGMKVQHKLFGIGKVMALQGSGDDTKVKVFFRAAGEKTLMLKHANLTVLND
ncbi:MAG: UvrD-helicase domain-containing protein [Chlorobiales bacterium]|nr:UvrD-helicase domain-containing protein [Chlorobiales bacterium]